MTTIIQSNGAIVCPRAGAEPLVIEMENIHHIESRVQEVAYVTPAKGPELLARFNEAYLYLHRQVTLLEHEALQAERTANKLRAIILLDKVPSILKEKGLAQARSPAGSEDLRNAVLDMDEDYQNALALTHEIRCVIELLKGKLKGVEMAYTSVKKILGEGTFNFKNPALSGGAPTDSGSLKKPLDQGPVQVTPRPGPAPIKNDPVPTKTSTVWGKARYDE